MGEQRYKRKESLFYRGFGNWLTQPTNHEVAKGIRGFVSGLGFKSPQNNF